jgi:glycosyltransferase involved in cell wall biosynthesis
VIHNAHALPAPLARPVSAPKGLVFGYIGALLKVKGIELLLESFKVFREQAALDATLLLAGLGEPAYVSSLRNRFENSNTRFIGYAAPVAFFSQLDVCVVPSLWEEPLATVVFESLHFGVPVIGSRRGGTPEMLQHEVNGLLFEPRTPGALVEALRRVSGDTELLAAMKRRSPGSVARFVDVSRMLNEYEQTFECIVPPISPSRHQHAPT